MEHRTDNTIAESRSSSLWVSIPEMLSVLALVAVMLFFAENVKFMYLAIGFLGYAVFQGMQSIARFARGSWKSWLTFIAEFLPALAALISLAVVFYFQLSLFVLQVVSISIVAFSALTAFINIFYWNDLSKKISKCHQNISNYFDTALEASKSKFIKSIWIAVGFTSVAIFGALAFFHPVTLFLGITPGLVALISVALVLGGTLWGIEKDHDSIINDYYRQQEAVSAAIAIANHNSASLSATSHSFSSDAKSTAEPPTEWVSSFEDIKGKLDAATQIYIINQVVTSHTQEELRSQSESGKAYYHALIYCFDYKEAAEIYKSIMSQNANFSEITQKILRKVQSYQITFSGVKTQGREAPPAVLVASSGSSSSAQATNSL